MANTTCAKKSTFLAIKILLCQASKVDHRHLHHLRFNSKVEYNFFSLPEQNLGLRFQKDATRKNFRDMAIFANVPPGNSPPVDPSPGHWNYWTIGAIIFSIILSFTRSKWGPLLQFKEKIDTTIDEAERVADIVEEVAEGVEKIAEGAVKHLPEGKLHDAAEIVEKVAADLDKNAEIAQDVLEKVEDVEKEVDSFFESTSRRKKNIVVTKDSKDKK
ncbi:hypothetical protein Fmac_031553 [Flemingia macrophylla]|uniref:Uncharacterized protein n=1 Tax=Flemingia macrophylla TaxID=520843 RepID=A0ABD1L2F4_9FABA